MSEPRLGEDLHGRTVLVTGASGGIGLACASVLARDGANLAVSDADADRLEHATATLAAARADVLAVRADVTDETQCDELVAAALDRFGRVDGAVLAAGVARHVPLLSMTRADWEAMLAVHLTGAFLCLRSVARAMVAGGGGSVVYVGSTVAAGAGPLHQAHYVAAKAGALGLVRAAARELGPHGIRVNAVSPGFTRTPMNRGLFTEEEVQERALAAPLGRVAEPDDIAGVVAFLLSERAGFITGEDVRVDGGKSLG